MVRLPLCAVALFLAAVPSAYADGSSANGGAAPPQVKDAKCADGTRWSCGPGQRLTVAGEQIDAATAVVFMGGRGRRDDRAAKPRPLAAHRVSVRIPRDARTGQLRVRVAGSQVTSDRPLEVTRSAAAEEPQAGPTTKVFAGSRRVASFTYRVSAPLPQGAAVEIVRIADGTVVARRPIDVAAGGTATATFNGLVRGLPVPVGRYAFRPSAGSDDAITPEAGQATEFSVYDHFFPIRGPHDLGQTATNNFGGGRGHKGQDMFAACGTPLAAVTSGTVTAAGYQSAAGNYLVLKRADGQSYAYMHMRDRPLVDEGDKVYTGQRVGVVGESGRATGCHLHFELWTAPGWWDGGEAIDPLPALKKWDSWS